jgi:hypothetical protein
MRHTPQALHQHIPASSIASMTSRGPVVPEASSVTMAELSSRLTDTDCTPGNCSTTVAQHSVAQHGKSGPGILLHWMSACTRWHTCITARPHIQKQPHSSCHQQPNSPSPKTHVTQASQQQQQHVLPAPQHPGQMPHSCHSSCLQC